MPPLLRSRLAVVGMFSVFLIPIVLSSLRGLTHVLTCSEQVETPFQVILVEGGGPIVTGSTTLTPGDTGLLCGGLDVDLSVAPAENADVTVRVNIENRTADDWFGTVQLVVIGTRLPIDLGRVDGGSTSSRELPLRLPEGVTEFSGSLLIGP